MKHALLFPAYLVAVAGYLLASPAKASLADLLAEAEIAQELQRENLRDAGPAATATEARVQEAEQPDEVSGVFKKLPEADQPQEKAEAQEVTSEREEAEEAEEEAEEEEEHRSKQEASRGFEEAPEHQVEDVKMIEAEEGGFGGVEHSEEASGQKKKRRTSD
ncbi:hypothetical protein TGME49_251660 [Toxoplasma gondii ME49]|uniref:Uncharacterized protein n=1 Tax=Toxoplasma gondii (strain ATCC 50611 / Me49) TaxID=508771 RepID=S8EPC7_TOXGM|nr:hypothetical protein TGME49_251660 [Toxoplasma gondii ME49]EPT25231.1 hypothetical protein TGME49_251660 [Toxoplasma gondii ME49]|eukprot:XP_002367407.1 hypothetical protein TGME49_251660 [Toxoplasma gondii ME49]